METVVRHDATPVGDCTENKCNSNNAFSFLLIIRDKREKIGEIQAPILLWSLIIINMCSYKSSYADRIGVNEL